MDMTVSTGMTHLSEGRAKHERSVAAEISNLLVCVVQLARILTFEYARYFVVHDCKSDIPT